VYTSLDGTRYNVVARSVTADFPVSHQNAQQAGKSNCSRINKRRRWRKTQIGRRWSLLVETCRGLSSDGEVRRAPPPTLAARSAIASRRMKCRKLDLTFERERERTVCHVIEEQTIETTSKFHSVQPAHDEWT
jgi:hypothetical protein